MTIIQFSVGKPEHFPEAGTFFQDLANMKTGFGYSSVVIEAVAWEKLWHFIQTKSVNQIGLDVSEVGTTWMGALLHNKLLRPFSADELNKIGGKASLQENAWRNTPEDNEGRPLCIPWMSDVRVVYYWKDMFQQAGVEGEGGFSSIAETDRTLAKLHNAGIPAWGAPTFGCNNNVHHAASWIWATGKDYICNDQKRTFFCDDAALQGLTEYFKLYQYMPRAFVSLDDLLTAFLKEEIAAVIDGPWLVNRILQQDPNGLRLQNLGITLPPGPPFVGGSNLVVWKFIPESKIETAIQLIQELLSFEIQHKVSSANGLIPVRKALLHRHPFSNNPQYELIQQASKMGRQLPTTHLWGTLESGLVQAFGDIWRDIRAGEFIHTDDVIRRHLSPLSERFDDLVNQLQL